MGKQRKPRPSPFLEIMRRLREDMRLEQWLWEFELRLESLVLPFRGPLRLGPNRSRWVDVPYG